MEFVVAKRRFDLDPRDIPRRLEGVEPELIRTYAVRIKGKLYPCKQVLSVLTGLPKASFDAHQAYRILERMGLEVVVGKGRTR